MENICLNLTINQKIKSKIETKLGNLNIEFDNYVENLIKKDVEAYTEFDEGFYFDIYANKLFSRFKSEIVFTKLEEGLFHLLLSKRGEIVSIDEIKEVVWEGKDMSIFSLRNVVKKIRDKTYREIIRTYSNNGYQLN